MNQFSHEQELANYLMSSDLPQYSLAAILELYRQTQNDPNLPVSVTYKRYSGYNPPNATVIAFCCTPICTVQHLQGEGKDLVSSATLKESMKFPLFEFLSTEVNPSFSIHKAAIQLYVSIHGQLRQEEIDITKPLIITGHSLGGSVATLFTLWLLGSIYSKMNRNTKRPICLTFGSPLLGDDGFQRAILNRPTWNSCFINVVSKQDPVPSFFISPYNTQTRSPYKPFGLVLFCSETGVACFSEPESVLELLGVMSSHSMPAIDYGWVLECLKYKAIFRGSLLGGWDNNPFRTGITLQLQAIGVDGMQQPQQQNNDLTTKIEEKQKNSFVWKTNSLDSDKELNAKKINMAYLEWYKKVTWSRGGYYDSYKSAWSRSRDEIRSKEEIVRHQGILARYWKRMVAEAKKTDGASFAFRYLMAGNNYRRMVEPLDIAEYYKQGKKDYRALRRSEHYMLLEKWLDRSKKPNQRNKACSFNEDSCFWARVEEALILLGMLKDGESIPDDEELLRKLNGFEEYVMDSIHNQLVDPEIFLERSSFMTWWNIYRGRKGNEYDSPLANFMMNKCYQSYS